MPELPELPDLVSKFESLRAMPELPGLASAFENLKILPELIDADEVVQKVAGELDDSMDVDPTPTPDASSSCNQLLLRVGFDVRLESAPMPQPIESSEAYATPDPQHWMVLCELERHLRQVVRDHLTSLVGSNWIRQRVPQDVRENWQERQEEDRADGRPVHDLIQYADFMDLPKIITRSDNWRDVFQATFRNRSEVVVSFRRLNPIRKSLAHSRPLSQMDVLILTAETSWLLGRLKIRALH